MNQFRQRRLGDVLTFQRGFDITKAEQTEGVIPIVSSSGVSSFHDKWKVRGPGVVIGRKGTLGTVHYLRDDFWPHDTTLWIKDFKGNSPRFLAYFLKTMRLENFDVGASNPTVNRNHLHKIKILFPKTVDTQKRIAAILSAYDELIENNKRRIGVLEKLAEEIYREWFLRLRFPGHEDVKKVKGVPIDWTIKRFHEIVEYYVGGGWGEDNESTSFSDGAFVIRGTDIPHVQIGAFDKCPFRYHKTSNLKSRRLKAGDFVFEVSGGSKDQLLGRNVLVTESMLNHLKAPVIPASFCKLIRFRRELASPYFMKYFLKLYYDYDLVGIFQVQSTGISNYQFESFLKFQTVILPSVRLQDVFEEKIKPILELKDSISLVNIGLRKTRDLLLPRVISGKFPVENLDIQFPPGMIEELDQNLNGSHHA